MRFYATLDTAVFGVWYSQGEEINTQDWERAQFLQYLGLGLMVADPDLLAGSQAATPIPMLVEEITPSTPVLAEANNAFTVRWDGLTNTGTPAVEQGWASVEIYASVVGGFTYSPDTLKGSYSGLAGGTQLVMTGPEYEPLVADIYEVLLLARNRSGGASLPSLRATVLVGQMTIDIPDLSLTVLKFNTRQHLLY